MELHLLRGLTSGKAILLSSDGASVTFRGLNLSRTLTFYVVVLVAYGHVVDFDN